MKQILLVIVLAAILTSCHTQKKVFANETGLSNYIEEPVPDTIGEAYDIYRTTPAYTNDSTITKAILSTRLYMMLDLLGETKRDTTIYLDTIPVIYLLIDTTEKGSEVYPIIGTPFWMRGYEIIKSVIITGGMWSDYNSPKLTSDYVDYTYFHFLQYPCCLKAMIMQVKRLKTVPIHVGKYGSTGDVENHYYPYYDEYH